MLTDEMLIDVPGVHSRWVRLATGAAAHYATAGENGPAVVLLHGGGAGSSGLDGWRFMAAFLGANGFRVYCPDQPGFGLTLGADCYVPGPAGHVDFLQDFANALCLDKFFLGGDSMGCQNALSYVGAHPERVTAFAVVVTSTGIQGLIDEDTRVRADNRTDEQRRLYAITRNFEGTKESMKGIINAMAFRKDLADDDDLVSMRTFAANRNADYAQLQRNYFEKPEPNLAARLSLKGRIDRISMPAIYVRGLQDICSSLAVTHLQEDALPGVQFFYPDECGHIGQIDQPEMFNQLFLEFFRPGKISRATANWAGISNRRPVISELVDY